MKILAVFPESIGGRLTMQSIFDGFEMNGAKLFFYDVLKDNINSLLQIYNTENIDFLVSYDFAGLRIKEDNNLKIKTINYFSDVIEDDHSGKYWKSYYKCLNEPDNYTFYWDEELFSEKKKEIKSLFYQPHFVNTEVYKNFNLNPQADIMFAGRLDTDFRLSTMLDLMKTFEDKVFHWYAIERHFLDAKSRCKNEYEQKLLEKNYKGFISTEKDMADAINNSKICFNFNAQGVSSLNYRTFQVMACERIMLSDNRTEAHKLFSPDKDIVIYQNMQDLKDKINLYLNDANLYKSTASQARESIVQKHSAKLSVQKMLNLIGL